MKNENSSVKYEYFLPISSENTTHSNLTTKNEQTLKTSTENGPTESIPKSRYKWKVVGFSACSKSCGGGLQTPIIKCIKDNSNTFFAQRKCAKSKRPLLNENLLKCNTQPCPAYWRIEDWNPCNCSSSKTTSREVRCVQELSSGIVIQVNNSDCIEEKPTETQNCECSQEQINGRYQTSKSSGRRISKRPTWLYSNWNDHCSSTCNTGFEYRTIFCERSDDDHQSCDIDSASISSRSCNENVCENAEWFAGPWSECSGSCFNLTKTRQIMCIKSNSIVDLKFCRHSKKPRTLLPCSFKDVEYCQARWHFSDWSEVNNYIFEELYKLTCIFFQVFQILQWCTT